MKEYCNLKGLKIGCLEVLGISNKIANNKTTKLWECKCDCGNICYRESRILNQYINKNNNAHCGCKNKLNLIGQKFGDLTIIGKKDELYNNKIVWICQCKCGDIIYKTKATIDKNSNLCLKERHELAIKRKSIIHILNSIKSRCHNPNDKSYKDYGNRGIKVCDEWLNSNDCFFDWAINNGYEKGLEIDRINNNGDYEPSNCRWVDKYIQANNKRTNILIEYNGKIQTLKQWCVELNLPYRKTHKRIRQYNWAIEKAFNKIM